MLTGTTGNPANNPAAQAVKSITSSANDIRLAEARKRAALAYQNQGAAINQNVISGYDKTIADTRAANPQAAEYVDAAKSNPGATAGQYIGDIKGMAPDRTALYDPALSAASLNKATGGVDYSNIFKGTGYKTGQQELNGIISNRDELVQRYLDEAAAQKNLRADTFTRLFGPDSRLAEFYSPNLKAIQAQISGLTGDLTNLDENINSRFGGQVLTDAQKAKIGQQERGQLTRQLDDMTRAQQSITDALNLDRTLSEAEFNAVIDDATNYLGMLETQYRELGMPEQQIQFLTNAVANQFNREATMMAEQMGIAEELRATGRAGLEVDRNLSSDLGYMVNSQGQYMLDENFNPIPYSPAGGSELQFKTVGKAAYVFDPATGETRLVEGTGNAGGSDNNNNNNKKTSFVTNNPAVDSMDFATLVRTIKTQYPDILTEYGVTADDLISSVGTGKSYNGRRADTWDSLLRQELSTIMSEDNSYLTATAAGKQQMSKLEGQGIKPSAELILPAMRAVDPNATIEDARDIIRGVDTETVVAKEQEQTNTKVDKAFASQAEANIKKKMDLIIKNKIGPKPPSDSKDSTAWVARYNAIWNKWKSTSYATDLEKEVNRLKNL